MRWRYKSASAPKNKIQSRYAARTRRQPGHPPTTLGVVALPAPWLGSRLWENYSARLPFAITAVSGLLAAGVAFIKFRLPKEAQELTV